VQCVQHGQLWEPERRVQLHLVRPHQLGRQHAAGSNRREGALLITAPTNITHFPTPADLRKWFRAHHASADELWIGYYKRGTGRPSVTWQESVDEALCVGWIDGIRKSVDADRYTIRFTPRRKGSVWSAVNIRRVAALTKEKRMRPAGLEAFAARVENK